MGNVRRFTPAVEQEIVDKNQSGIAMAQLAKEYGCASETVRRLVEERGLTPFKATPVGKKPEMSAETEQQAVVFYESGLSAQKVADELGLSRKQVLAAVRRAGKEVRTAASGPTNGERVFEQSEIDLVLDWYNNGHTIGDIARRLKTSNPKISRILREAGTIRRGSRYGTVNKVWKPRKRMHQGYVRVKVHRDDEFYPFTDGQDYMLEHRYVMMKSLGRSLEKDESVHHINGDRADNRIENLQLRQGRHGKGQVWKCNSCGSDDIVSAEL